MAALAQSSETPERVWNRGMQRAAAEEVAHLAAAARAHQAAAGALDWQPAEGPRLQFAVRAVRAGTMADAQPSSVCMPQWQRPAGACAVR